MSEPRFGLIGAGGIGNIHLETCAALDLPVVAVADVNPVAAEKTARRWGVPDHYADYHELLGRNDIDAVFVCTPTGSHAAPAIAAMRAGKHVLVEKPMDASLVAATEMVRTAHETGRVMMVGLKLRFTPQVLAAKRMIDAGLLGDIYYAEATADRRRSNPGGSFIRRDLAGYGASADLGIYAIDTAIHLMGAPRPVAVTSIVSDYMTRSVPPLFGKPDHSAHMEVEDFAAAWVCFENGARLVVKTSWCTHLDSMGGTYFLGQHAGLRLGILEVRGPGDGVWLYRDEQGVMTDTQVKGLPDIDFRAAFRLEERAFADAVAAGGPSPVDPDEALLSNMVIDGIIRSSAAGGIEVAIPAPGEAA